jgi:hypothetical protein
MSVKVELAVDLAANGIGDYFTLDDSTKGILGGTVYKLAGDVLVDLTSYVRSVQVRRGRSRVLERFQPGIAEVVLDNRGRDFDPTYVAQQATRTNLVTNPSFEVDTTGWGTYGVSLARVTSDSRFSSACSSATYTGAVAGGPFINPRVAVTAGTAYTFSVYVKDVSTSKTFRANVEWYNALSGGSVTGVTYGTATSVTTTGWTRLSVTGTAPVGTTHAVPTLYATSTPPASSVVLLDAALLETGSTLQSYFDGSVSDNSIRVVSRGWTGTANASTSTITYWVPGTGSPYSGSIVPRKGVRITYSGQPLYEGLVEDWMFDFGLDGDATAVMRCVDGFASISQATVTAGTQATTGSGARVGAVLDDAGWPTLHRVISTGLATLDNDVVTANTNVATYLAKVESSEQGAFFFDKSNMATFLDRAQVQDPTSGGVEFGTSVPFVSFEAASLTDEMRNSVAVTYTAGTVVAGTATASSSSSITAYGQIDYSLDTLVSTNLQAQAIADFLVNQYSEPRFRVDGLTVIVDALSPTQALSVVDLELADIVTVAVSLPNINSVGSALSRTVAIDEISHSIDIDRHLISFRTSDAITGFVLDSSDFGVLDINQLGF